MSDVANAVRSIIADHFGVRREKVADDATLDDLGADSLDGVEIVMTIEETYGVEIGDPVLERVNTVGQMIEAARKAVAAGNGDPAGSGSARTAGE